MSRVSVSKSYAVLMGVQGFQSTKQKVKSVEATLVHGKEKLLHPDKVREQEERQRDKSQSAEKERKHLESLESEKGEKEQKDLPERKGVSSLVSRLLKKSQA
jgi:uncharacterized membrane protein